MLENIDGRRVEVENRMEAQHYQTHTMAILAHDTFMSGWGKARNGESWVAWCCRPEDHAQVLDWVAARGDTKHVNVFQYRDLFELSVPNDCVHFSIYVVEEGHPALQQAA